MSIERVVALFTPLFAAAAGFISTEVATLVGVQIPRQDFVAIFITGATAATAAALKWLHGRAQFTAIEQEAGRIRTNVATEAGKLAGDPVAGPALADIEGLLKTHTAEIEQAIESHVPSVVAQALGNLFASLGKTPAAAASGSADYSGGTARSAWQAPGQAAS